MNPVRKKSLILITDDNPKNLQLLGSLLRQEEYSVAAAMSGAETITALENLSPDLILLDVMMPGMDGFEVCQKLKAEPRTRNIPIIFITALNETENLLRGFEVGGLDYITKPFVSAELHARVRTHLALKHFQDELREKNEELARLNNEKNELLGIVAHDLRNPLTVVQGCAQLLDTDSVPLPESDRELLNKISTSTERMIELVNNLLDVNAIEQGQMRLKSETFDLRSVVQQIIQSHVSQAVAKKIQVIFTPPPSPLSVTADASATMQIIDNLISNALKYSPCEREINVRLHLHESRVRCEVKDQGPGLNADDLKKLFGKFARLSARPTNGEQSVGLGLSIVKKLTESMSGRVWCESELGKGASFILELPSGANQLTPLAAAA